MYIEDVDEVGLELLQAVAERHLEGAFVVAAVVHTDALAVTVLSVWGCVLGSNDHEVPVLLLLHPFANPGFGLFVLVVVGTA